MGKEQSLTIYKQTDEYQALVEECQAIITEGVVRFREERILMYGRLGQRIVEDSLYEKHSRDRILKTIAEDVGISYSDICRAVQFYEKFKIASPESENWSKFKEGKNISWSKIKSLYLPIGERKDCNHIIEKIILSRCKMCKKIIERK